VYVCGVGHCITSVEGRIEWVVLKRSITIEADGVRVVMSCKCATDCAGLPAFTLVVAHTLVPLRAAANGTVCPEITVGTVAIPSVLHALTVAITLQLPFLREWAGTILAGISIKSMIADAATLSRP
jgi:hypothetical protein